jgi:hypothetical protein
MRHGAYSAPCLLSLSLTQPPCSSPSSEVLSIRARGAQGLSGALAATLARGSRRRLHVRVVAPCQREKERLIGSL